MNPLRLGLGASRGKQNVCPRVNRVDQKRSSTKFRPFKPRCSSYLLFLGRFGSLTLSFLIFLCGMVERICEMQLSRARRLSLERMMYQGASLLSVSSNILSRALV